MNTEIVIRALAIPNEAKVSHRVPKKLLLEQGAPTSADKRYIHDGIEELNWIAALKPTNIGIGSYRGEFREYIEIAVLSGVFRSDVKAVRLIELIHRAIPYPVVLIVACGGKITLSLAHKRFSQNKSKKMIIDGGIVSISMPAIKNAEKMFLDRLALSAQSAQNLFMLYQGWIERMDELAAARITGRFSQTSTPEHGSTRRGVLIEHAQLERELDLLRAQAAKEKQINRRVELNLAIKKLEARLKECHEQL